MVSVIKILYKSYIYHFPYNTCYTPTNNHYGRINQYNWRAEYGILKSAIMALKALHSGHSKF